MKRFTSIFLILITTITTIPAFATENYDIDKVTEDTISYIYKTVSNPQVGSVGGEWTVLGLARSSAEIPEGYYQNYYEAVEECVKDGKGILHDKKYTEYSRVILALTSIGKNPADVGGYNLLTPLGDYEKTLWQGINGAIWALIALDSGNYDIPKNPDAKIQATREMYINHILENQTHDGGWSLTGDTADPDVTAMALQALSKYQDNDRVSTAAEKALVCLSEMQNENGGFGSIEAESSESCVQVLVALCELGISVDDSRFVKCGNSVLDNLLTFYDSGKGFRHTHKEAAGLMATEQSFYALVALKRKLEDKNSFYDMSDAKKLNVGSYASGLNGKNADVRKVNISIPGKTFSDIGDHKYKIPIEELASREIINGKTESFFEPDSTMSRAEFAAIIARGLGLPQRTNSVFDDVTPGNWFYYYVATAHSYGIIKGVSDSEFNPHGTITRQEAAVMIQRAAKLCGLDTEMDSGSVRDVLAQFFDYVKAADWSVSSLAFCYDAGILSDDAMDIKPKEAITRGEIASMLYNMLLAAKLL